jgi:uncharacterized protein (TIGR00730 family)
MSPIPVAIRQPRKETMSLHSANLRSVCVFCGSAYGHDPKWGAAARQLGKGIAAAGLTLVYGGSYSGLMGQVAESALLGGGRVEGIIPRHLLPNEDPFDCITELTVVEDMHSRKKLMFEKADAFCILPGGLGTLDETFEILTWKQLGLHDKPVLLINLDGYWTPWLALLAQVVEQGFAQPRIMDFYQVVDSVEATLDQLSLLPAGTRGEFSRL